MLAPLVRSSQSAHCWHAGSVPPQDRWQPAQPPGEPVDCRRASPSRTIGSTRPQRSLVTYRDFIGRNCPVGRSESRLSHLRAGSRISLPVTLSARLKRVWHGRAPRAQGRAIGSGGGAQSGRNLGQRRQFLSASTGVISSTNCTTSPTHESRSPTPRATTARGSAAPRSTGLTPRDSTSGSPRPRAVLKNEAELLTLPHPRFPMKQQRKRE